MPATPQAAPLDGMTPMGITPKVAIVPPAVRGTVTANADLILRALKAVGGSRCKDETRYTWAGVHVVITGNKVTFETTDGHSLVRCTFEQMGSFSDVPFIGRLSDVDLKVAETALKCAKGCEYSLAIAAEDSANRWPSTDQVIAEKREDTSLGKKKPYSSDYELEGRGAVVGFNPCLVARVFAPVGKATGEKVARLQMPTDAFGPMRFDTSGNDLTIVGVIMSMRLP